VRDGDDARVVAQRGDVVDEREPRATVDPDVDEREVDGLARRVLERLLERPREQQAITEVARDGGDLRPRGVVGEHGEERERVVGGASRLAHGTSPSNVRRAGPRIVTRPSRATRT